MLEIGERIHMTGIAGTLTGVFLMNDHAEAVWNQLSTLGLEETVWLHGVVGVRRALEDMEFTLHKRKQLLELFVARIIEVEVEEGTKGAKRSEV